MRTNLMCLRMSTMLSTGFVSPTNLDLFAKAEIARPLHKLFRLNEFFGDWCERVWTLSRRVAKTRKCIGQTCMEGRIPGLEFQWKLSYNLQCVAIKLLFSGCTTPPLLPSASSCHFTLTRCTQTLLLIHQNFNNHQKCWNVLQFCRQLQDFDVTTSRCGAESDASWPTHSDNMLYGLESEGHFTHENLPFPRFKPLENLEQPPWQLFSGELVIKGILNLTQFLQIVEKHFVNCCWALDKRLW